MGSLHCQSTKEARKILKELGFKRGNFRIETVLRHTMGSGKEYGKTYIYMRTPVSDELVEQFKQKGFKHWFGATYPIFIY